MVQVDPSVSGFDPSNPSDIRDQGWDVAIHNDYWLNGQRSTFWLFTKRAQSFTGASYGIFVHGEGRSDVDALNAVRQMIGITQGHVSEYWNPHD